MQTSQVGIPFYLTRSLQDQRHQQNMRDGAIRFHACRTYLGQLKGLSRDLVLIQP